MTDIWDKDRHCPFPHYDKGARFYDSDKQYGYQCETTKRGVTLPLGPRMRQRQATVSENRKALDLLLAVSGANLIFLSFQGFFVISQKEPQNPSFLIINLEY